MSSGIPPVKGLRHSRGCAGAGCPPAMPPRARARIALFLRVLRPWEGTGHSESVAYTRQCSRPSWRPRFKLSYLPTPLLAPTIALFRAWPPITTRLALLPVCGRDNAPLCQQAALILSGAGVAPKGKARYWRRQGHPFKARRGGRELCHQYGGAHTPAYPPYPLCYPAPFLAMEVACEETRLRFNAWRDPVQESTSSPYALATPAGA